MNTCLSTDNQQNTRNIRLLWPHRFPTQIPIAKSCSCYCCYRQTKKNGQSLSINLEFFPQKNRHTIEQKKYSKRSLRRADVL
jgi:hypothetical protein